MKHLIFVILVFITFSACSSNNGTTAQSVNSAQKTGNFDLDLKALSEIVNSSKNSMDIEDKVNQPNGINNIDINNDGQIDYIKVTEFNDETGIGYTFTVLGSDSDIEVARITVNKQNNSAYVQGNPHYYGNDNSYQYDLLRDYLILSYLYHPHMCYISPYHYGFYPRTYTQSRVVTRSVYRTRTVVSTPSKSTTFKKIDNRSSVNNRSLSNQKNIHRSFETKPNKPTNYSGFKSSSSSSSTPKKYGWGSSGSSSSSSSSYSKPKSSSFGSSSSSSSRSSGFRSSSSRSSSRSRR